MESRDVKEWKTKHRTPDWLYNSMVAGELNDIEGVHLTEEDYLAKCDKAANYQIGLGYRGRS